MIHMASAMLSLAFASPSASLSLLENNKGKLNLGSSRSCFDSEKNHPFVKTKRLLKQICMKTSSTSELVLTGRKSYILMCLMLLRRSCCLYVTSSTKKKNPVSSWNLEL